MTEAGEDTTAHGARDRVTLACEAAVVALRAAGVKPEALAEWVPPRRGLLRTKPATMRPLGQVWRLGALLLGEDAILYAAGGATRAAERGRHGYQSVSREQRREVAAAALRGGYPIGTPVNYGATRLQLASTPAAESASGESPVGFVDGEFRVRWRTGAPLHGAPTVVEFLAERVALLVDPPLGAN